MTTLGRNLHETHARQNLVMIGYSRIRVNRQTIVISPKLCRWMSYKEDSGLRGLSGQCRLARWNRTVHGTAEPEFAAGRAYIAALYNTTRVFPPTILEVIRCRGTLHVPAPALTCTARGAIRHGNGFRYHRLWRMMDAQTAAECLGWRAAMCNMALRGKPLTCMAAMFARHFIAAAH